MRLKKRDTWIGEGMFRKGCDSHSVFGVLHYIKPISLLIRSIRQLQISSSSSWPVWGLLSSIWVF